MTNVVSLTDYRKSVRVVHESPSRASGPVTTCIQQGEAVIILGNGEAAVGHVPFPYPSAPAVDPRYLEALKAQKDRGVNG